jgi:hydrogenase maturation protein HypF
MAENGLFEKVIGVAFDGTGYGSDGQVWGGEFLLCDYHGFERRAHLRYVPLPGGDMAARQGWRMAAAHLFDALGENFRDAPLACWQAVPPAAWNLLPQMLRAPALRTSSCGRLFDAVSSLCGISHESSYEGESAMLLEAAAARETGPETYPIDLDTTTDPWTIDTRPLLRHIVQALARSTPSRTVAHCFHNSVAHIIEVACCKLRERTGVDKVCLSGGTFQNSTLLARVAARLGAQGLAVYLHSQVPPNDGGLSLGQAVIAASLFERM